MSLKKIILSFALTTTLASSLFSQSNKSEEAYNKAISFKYVDAYSDSTEYYLRKSIGYDGENLKAHEYLFQFYLEKNDDIDAMISLIDCMSMNKKNNLFEKKLKSIWEKNNSPGGNLDSFVENVDEKTLVLLADSLKNAGKTFEKIRYEYDQLGLEVPELSVNTREIYYIFARKVIMDLMYETNDKKAQLYVQRAKYYEQINEYTAALSEYTKAINTNPLNPKYHYEKGKAYLMLNYENRAKNEFIETIKLDSDNALANNQLGLIYFRNQDYATSIFYFTGAMLASDDLRYKKNLEMVWKKYNSPCINFDEFLNLLNKEFKEEKQKTKSFESAVKNSLNSVLESCVFD